MTLVIFDGNTKNYTLLNKKDEDLKIELIKVQVDENNNELPVLKGTQPKVPRKKKTKLKESRVFKLTN
jgi:di/tripeptidase